MFPPRMPPQNFGMQTGLWNPGADEAPVRKPFGGGDLPPLQSISGGGFMTGGPDYGPKPMVMPGRMPPEAPPMTGGGFGAEAPPLPSRPFGPPMGMPQASTGLMAPQGPQGPSMRDRFGSGLRTFGAKFGGPQPGGGGGAAGPGAMTGLQSFGTALSARRKAGAPRLGFGKKPPRM